MNSKSSLCPNCNHPVSEHYCSYCGQRNELVRLNLKEFFQEIPRSLFNIEQRYWHTIRDYLINPITMVREYSMGKRKYYAPPIQFLFFFASINLFLSLLLNKYVEGDSKFGMELEAGDTSFDYADRLRYVSDLASDLTDKYTNYFELGLPIFVGLLVFLFYRKKLNLAESMVYSFFLITLALEVPAIISVPLWSWSYVSYLDFVTYLGVVLYLSSFFGKPRILHALWGLLINLLALLLYLIVCITALFFISFLLI